MYFEKRWVAIPFRALTFNGTSDGVIKVATTSLLSVKQKITLRSNTQAPRILQINRVISATEIQVGELGEDIYKRADVSMFLVTDSALLFAEEQLRPKIGPEDFNRAVYAEEPIVANRSILVDELGNYYNDTNPIPVEMTFPDEPLKISGTKDGTPSGPEFGFVNNERLQILDAHDRKADFSYADFGTKNQRITRIDYTSATFPSATVRREFAYTLVGNNYRRDNETWTVI